LLLDTVLQREQNSRWGPHKGLIGLLRSASNLRQ
jgi:hypothetical protein